MADKLAATFHGASLTDTLRPILAAYRAEVAPHWSPATAHEDFDGKQGDPAGQCGVTSAWLQRRLRKDHGIETVYCTGMAWCLGQARQVRHCWLEIGEGLDRVIVDLTAEQVPGLRHWICATFRELSSGEIAYVANQWYTAEQLLADPVRARLAILTAEVGR